MVGRAKWNAWKKLGEMAKEEAMEQYVNAVNRLCPDWNKQTGESSTATPTLPTSGSKSATVSGPVSSKMERTEALLRDDEKTAFDWCKEGNAEKLEHLFRDDLTVCQLVDDQGMGLLHWACDRGYSDVVQILLSHNVNVNLQDLDGQTPLHYACSCDFVAVVRQLVEAKADVNLRDHDGHLPCDVAASKAARDIVSVGLARY
ncbi:acyl-CoA-binding domain-containing protein 6-like isoform X2 [Oscarella lobularis]